MELTHWLSSGDKIGVKPSMHVAITMTKAEAENLREALETRCQTKYGNVEFIIKDY